MTEVPGKYAAQRRYQQRKRMERLQARQQQRQDWMDGLSLPEAINAWRLAQVGDKELLKITQRIWTNG